MNLKNYFNEIKHFLNENADDFDDFYDFENLEDEDTGEIPPEDEGASQGEGNDPNNIPGQQNSAPALSPSEEPDPQAVGATAGNNPPPAPTAPDQGGNTVQQATGTNPGANQDGNVNPKTVEQQGDGESGKVPPSQPGTKKFGTILNQLKGLLDTFEQAKKVAGFETIDDVKKAAQENPAANGDDSTDGVAANTGDATSAA